VSSIRAAEIDRESIDLKSYGDGTRQPAKLLVHFVVGAVPVPNAPRAAPLLFGLCSRCFSPPRWARFRAPRLNPLAAGLSLERPGSIFVAVALAAENPR